MTREKLGLKIRDLAVRAKRDGLSLGHAVSQEVITRANVQCLPCARLCSKYFQIYMGGRRGNKGIRQKVRVEPREPKRGWRVN